MLTAITAPPAKIVQLGTRCASSAAARSHAHADAEVAISNRASRDSLGLEIAATSTSEITRSANTPIEEVIAPGFSSLATITPFHASQVPSQAPDDRVAA